MVALYWPVPDSGYSVRNVANHNRRIWFLLGRRYISGKLKSWASMHSVRWGAELDCCIGSRNGRKLGVITVARKVGSIPDQPVVFLASVQSHQRLSWIGRRWSKLEVSGIGALWILLAAKYTEYFQLNYWAANNPCLLVGPEFCFDARLVFAKNMKPIIRAVNKNVDGLWNRMEPVKEN